MQTGAGFLNRGNGVEGYPNVAEALKQMAAMISFCESAGGKGCKNCEFRLKIQMMLNPGDTMNQLAQGLGMGMGQGMGMGMMMDMHQMMEAHMGMMHMMMEQMVDRQEMLMQGGK